MVVAVDDNDCMNVMRLFNEPEGKKYLAKQGVKKELINQLDLCGISSIGNILGAIKMAKYYELTSRDYVLTVCTDSMELYDSRMQEMKTKHGAYSEAAAAKDYYTHIMGLKTDQLLELSYFDKKRVHNLKYYTWIEQQGHQTEELNRQWYDYPEYWDRIHAQIKDIDKVINNFNSMTGLL
jgi:hypothetical protein